MAEDEVVASPILLWPATSPPQRRKALNALLFLYSMCCNVPRRHLRRARVPRASVVLTVAEALLSA
jgi:hypothetical protein